MAVSTTIAIVGGLAVGAQVYQGEKQSSIQKKAMRRQEQAQNQSRNQAIGQEKLGRMAQAKANKKKPDIATLLGRNRATKGPSSTMLTGTGGAGGGLLGGKSMLGGA